MKYWIFWIVTILVLLPSCNAEEDVTVPIAKQNLEPFGSQEIDDRQWEGPFTCITGYASKTTTIFVGSSGFEQDYQIKSGAMTFVVWEGSNDSIWASWTEVINFDDYGRLERKDTYHEDGTLVGTFFRIDRKSFCLDPNEKIAYIRSNGSGYGIETRFDEIVQNLVIPSVKPIQESLAGQVCDMYLLPIDGGVSKYAGFGNIVFLSEYFSEGWGNYSRRAIEFTEGPVDPALFQIPEDFTVKD